ncbi:LysR family transcriptional regulator [Streptomyces amritsarensis]|uniref:LysR family transcriptional regulator n=1 Tax=Streptomyces amritsarensis TaxID=681158 RepID=A0ABX3G2P0_9ACTN|nr:LysR family transcriptional regulator [Streptomyces amritsarensis]OLZ66105.1 LysR family transcriptional regulator [Streptomyces amritsarensis]
MDLELRHLKIVRAVADAGSLTRAATALGLAQPALSTQLKRIERALGGTLFVRGREGVRPTALGQLVLERARVLLPAVCELQEEAQRFARQGGARGYRLGGTHGPLLGGLVDRLAHGEPGVPVTTYTSWSEKEVAGSVADGRLDFALVGVCGESAPPEPGRLAWMEVARDPVHVMLAEDHPLALARAPRDEVELAELAAEAWTDVPGDGCFGDCFAAACVRAGFTPACVYETDTASCVHLVQVGRAVGLCRATFPVTPGVVTRPLAGTPLVWRHVLGWHPAARVAARAADVLGHARAAHAEALARSAGASGLRAAAPASAAASASAA